MVGGSVVYGSGYRLSKSSSLIAFQMLTPVGALTACGCAMSEIPSVAARVRTRYYDEPPRPMLQGNYNHSADSGAQDRSGPRGRRHGAVPSAHVRGSPLGRNSADSTDRRYYQGDGV